MTKKSILFLFFVFGICQIAFSQSSDHSSKKGQFSLNSKVVYGKLENGLTYYIQHNEEPKNQALLRLVINAGSILEAKKQRGLAHFVEHMAFNGTKNFKKNKLIDFLESVGVQFGSHVNAHTSFNETVYKLSLPTDSGNILQKGFQILEDWASNITFTPKQIDKERGVIIEERRLRLGAQRRIREKIFPVLYHNSRYPERMPIGTLKVLKNFEYQQLISFYNEWYRPGLMAVVAVGDFDVSKVKNYIVNHFSSLKAPKNQKKRPVYSIPFQQKTLTTIVTDKDIRHINLNIYYKFPHLIVNSRDTYLQQLKRRLFNMMVSRRMSKLLMNPQAPVLQAGIGITSLLANVDAYKISVQPKEGQLTEALKEVLRENVRIKKYGFTSTELERAKRILLNEYQNLYQERSSINSHFWASNYVNNFLDGSTVPGIGFRYRFVTDHLEDISLKDIHNMIEELLATKSRVVILTAPQKKKDKLPAKDQLLNIIHNSSSLEVEPYQITEVNEPLFNKELKPGIVVKNERMKKSGLQS